MATERRHPSLNPVLPGQCETAYPTLEKSANKALQNEERSSPKGYSQTTDHADMIHNNHATPSSCWSNFTAHIRQPQIDSSNSPSTNLWYNGTAVEITAFPKPEIILPIIIIAKAVLPWAPVCTAAPTHVTIVPTRAEYLLPSRSLAKPERKT